MQDIELILYVKDQNRSAKFYSGLFLLSASLDVPGMTEFQLTSALKLGLMPENGISKIISPQLPHPSLGNGIPRCEIYIRVKNPNSFLQRGVKLGGKLISKLQKRDWGDQVGYLTDFDGHVIAFAAAQ